MYARRIAAVVGASAVALLAFQGSALAGSIVHPGVTGTLHVSNNTLSVKDSACDDDSVYAIWKTDGGAEQKINNTSGCNGVVTKPVPMGNGTRIFWKVCVDKSWPTSDSCSPWKNEII
jgi:hypothetical protein